MIHIDIIFVAIAIPRERIACEGVFAAIAPDFVIIGPAIDEVVAGAGFLEGIATRTIQGISLSPGHMRFHDLEPAVAPKTRFYRIAP